jgi:SAM-dependent methyltransferase
LGVDVFQYPGLTADQIVDPLHMPFADGSFDTVTLIANVNHIPQSKIRDEFLEIGRVLKPDGRLVITRIGTLVSFLTHNVVHLQSKLSSKYYDMDHERGLEDDERLSVPLAEINQLAASIGAKLQVRDRIWTQWWLNEVLVYERHAGTN